MSKDPHPLLPAHLEAQTVASDTRPDLTRLFSAFCAQGGSLFFWTIFEKSSPFLHPHPVVKIHYTSLNVFSRFVRPVPGALKTVHGSDSQTWKMFHANLLNPFSENIATCSKHFMSCSHLLSQVLFCKENAWVC